MCPPLNNDKKTELSSNQLNDRLLEEGKTENSDNMNANRNQSDQGVEEAQRPAAYSTEIAPAVGSVNANSDVSDNSSDEMKWCSLAPAAGCSTGFMLGAFPQMCASSAKHPCAQGALDMGFISTATDTVSSCCPPGCCTCCCKGLATGGLFAVAAGAAFMLAIAAKKLYESDCNRENNIKPS